jgi:ferritin
MDSLANDSLIAAFNEQVGNEMGASLQYVSIASYFAKEALPQLAKFFYRQAEEEREHAMKFVRFIVDVDEVVRIPAIPAPKAEFSSAREAVALSLAWEKTVTQQIYRLVDRAKSDNNYIALRFLDWFVTEQLEEVSSMSSLLQVIERAGDHGLLHVEDYLAREGMRATGGAESEEG